jgi:hypothetical protein
VILIITQCSAPRDFAFRDALTAWFGARIHHHTDAEPFSHRR